MGKVRNRLHVSCLRVEAGRPVTVFTLLRVCEAFNIGLEQLVSGLDRHFRKRKSVA